MRRLVIVSAVMGLVAAGGPSGAHTGVHNVTFTAGTPCAVACPYWLSQANSDLDGDGTDDVHFSECIGTTPWTEGTAYDDIESEAIPNGTDLVILEIFPSVDFDSYICEKGDTWDGDGQPSELLASGAAPLAEPCDNVVGPNNLVPVGCREKAQINAKVGKRVIFRVYNWSDVASTPGRYTFKNV